MNIDRIETLKFEDIETIIIALTDKYKGELIDFHIGKFGSDNHYHMNVWTKEKK